jgi:hypothetical protein
MGIEIITVITGLRHGLAFGFAPSAIAGRVLAPLPCAQELKQAKSLPQLVIVGEQHRTSRADSMLELLVQLSRERKIHLAIEGAFSTETAIAMVHNRQAIFIDSREIPKSVLTDSTIHGIDNAWELGLATLIHKKLEAIIGSSDPQTASAHPYPLLDLMGEIRHNPILQLAWEYVRDQMLYQGHDERRLMAAIGWYLARQPSMFRELPSHTEAYRLMNQFIGHMNQAYQAVAGKALGLTTQERADINAYMAMRGSNLDLSKFRKLRDRFVDEKRNFTMAHNVAQTYCDSLKKDRALPVIAVVGDAHAESIRSQLEKVLEGRNVVRRESSIDPTLVMRDYLKQVHATPSAGPIPEATPNATEEEFESLLARIFG